MNKVVNDLTKTSPIQAAIFAAILMPAPQTAQKAVREVCKGHDFNSGLVSRLHRFADGCSRLATAFQCEAEEIQRAIGEMAAIVDGE